MFPDFHRDPVTGYGSETASPGMNKLESVILPVYLIPYRIILNSFLRKIAITGLEVGISGLKISISA
jgi:hypothetical protein